MGVQSQGTARTRWLGDLRTCFLLDSGWAFRTEINRFMLDGREGWRFPVAFGEFVGLAPGETRELNVNDSRQTLVIERGRGTCTGSSIGALLSELQASEGDLGFLQVRGSDARLLLRRRAELAGAPPLEQLLWSCGFEPDDPAVKRDPWARLGRALGGAAAGRDEVRQRLLVRRDDRLLELLEDAKAVTASRATWPHDWQYTCAWEESEEHPALVSEGGARRVLLGILDASNQPPKGLVLGDGNLLWMETREGDDDLDQVFRNPPPGLIPAGRRTGWCRWLRVEHDLRLASLGGDTWQVTRSGSGGWMAGGLGFESLLDALEYTPLPRRPFTGRPSVQVRASYPRSASAFRSLTGEAVRHGLSAIHSDSDAGFRATYPRGSVSGASLHEVLTPR